MSTHEYVAYKALAELSIPQYIRPAFSEDTNKLIASVATALDLSMREICLVLERDSAPSKPPIHKDGPLAGHADWTGFTPTLGLTVRIAARADASASTRGRIDHAGQALVFSI